MSSLEAFVRTMSDSARMLGLARSPARSRARVARRSHRPSASFVRVVRPHRPRRSFASFSSPSATVTTAGEGGVKGGRPQCVCLTLHTGRSVV